MGTSCRTDLYGLRALAPNAFGRGQHANATIILPAAEPAPADGVQVAQSDRQPTGDRPGREPRIRAA